MNTPLSWIKAYVPELECTTQEYVDAMTLSGTKVEGYTELDKNLEKIVVGKILKIEKHLSHSYGWKTRLQRSTARWKRLRTTTTA